MLYPNSTFFVRFVNYFDFVPFLRLLRTQFVSIQLMISAQKESIRLSIEKRWCH